LQKSPIGFFSLHRAESFAVFVLFQPASKISFHCFVIVEEFANSLSTHVFPLWFFFRPVAVLSALQSLSTSPPNPTRFGRLFLNQCILSHFKSFLCSISLFFTHARGQFCCRTAGHLPLIFSFSICKPLYGTWADTILSLYAALPLNSK